MVLIGSVQEGDLLNVGMRLGTRSVRLGGSCMGQGAGARATSPAC